jgi:hypothetical protein
VTNYQDKMSLLIKAEDKASATLNNVSVAAGAVLAGYLSWQGAKAVFDWVLDAGQKHERAWNDVAASLDRHGIAVDSNLLKIQKFADGMQTLTGVSDEVIGKGVQTFIDYNNTVGRSMELMEAAADLSAGAGMDMKASIDLIAKASVGYTATLSRYGIILDENLPKEEKFAAALDMINDRWGGAAASRAEDTTTRIALMGEKVGDLGEKLFYIGSPAITGSIDFAIESLDSLMQIVDWLNPPLDEMQETFIEGIKNAGDLTDNINSLTTAFESGKISLDEFAAGLAKLDEAIPVEDTTDWTDSMQVYKDALAALAKEYEDIPLDRAWEYSAAIKELEDVTPPWVLVEFTRENMQAAIDAEQAAADTALNEAQRHAQWIIRMADKKAAVDATLASMQAMMDVEDEDLGKDPGDKDVELEDATERYLKQLALEQDYYDKGVALAGASAQRKLEIHADHMVKTGQWTAKQAVAFLATENKKLAAYRRMSSLITENARSAVTKNIAAWVDGSAKLRDIWKNMAADFARLFIQQILDDVAIKLIGDIAGGGILGALGSLFDTKANDDMAETQGRDFAMHFTKGVTGGLEGMAGVLAGGAPEGPVMGGAATGGGGVIILQVDGSGGDGDRLLEKILPRLEEKAESGESILLTHDRFDQHIREQGGYTYGR